MEWLFGGEQVDLTAAQRAIDQLASERSSLEDQTNKLQDILEQQKCASLAIFCSFLLCFIAPLSPLAIVQRCSFSYLLGNIIQRPLDHICA